MISDFCRFMSSPNSSFTCLRKWVTLSLVCFAAGCSATVSESSSPDAAPAAANAAAPPALVRVQAIRRESIAPLLSAVGTVRPRHFSVIASAADGVVDEFAEEQGRFVKAETVLSRLRMYSTDLGLAEARAILAAKQADVQQILQPRKEDVEEAEAQEQAAAAAFANAERRLKELKSLAARGATNQSSVDDAEILVDEVRQRMLAAKAVNNRVSAGAREEEKIRAKAELDAQQKHVEWLEAEKEKRITRAPFDGFIVKEHTYLGQWLSKGAPVATMVQLDEVDVEVLVDQSFIAQVNIGDKVRLKVAGTPNPKADDGYWIGTVYSVVPSSDWANGSRSFPVILRVKNEMTGSADLPIPALREGMMAEAEFFGSQQDALLIPKDAMVRTSRGTFVFAINARQPDAAEDAADSVRQVMIETGISQGGWIQAISSELQAGEQVVTEGAERLRPFQSVRIMTETAGQ